MEASARRSLASAFAHLSPFPHFSPGRVATAAGPIASPDPLDTASVTLPFLLPLFTSSSSSLMSSACHLSQRQRATSPSSSADAMRSFASGVRIEGLVSSSNGGGGPAFVVQVFSMLDPSGNGLMVMSLMTTRFDILFLTKRFEYPFVLRTPEWIKKMLATIRKNEEKGPVFGFFMDFK